MIFVILGGQEGKEIRSFAIDQAKFKKGSFLFVNLSSQEIATSIGEDKFVLEPGSNQSLRPQANRGANLAFTSFHLRNESGWKPFFSSNWPIDKASRAIVIFHQNSKGRFPQFHTIVDYPASITPQTTIQR